MIARKFSLLRSFTWAATLATGFGTVWFVPAVGLATLIDYVWQGGWRSGSSKTCSWSGPTARRSISEFPATIALSETDRDLKGVVQDATRSETISPGVYLFGAQAEHLASFPGESAGRQRLTLFVQPARAHRELVLLDDGKPDGAGYFVVTTARVIEGSVSLDCPVSARMPVPAADWIPVLKLCHRRELDAVLDLFGPRRGCSDPHRATWPPRSDYLPSGSQLGQADLAARTVTTVFESAEPIESIGIPTLAYWSTGRSTTEQPILVRTTRQIHVLDHKHHVKKVFSHSRPNSTGGARSYWYEIRSGQAIAVIFPAWSTGPRVNGNRKLVYRIKGDGAIEDQFRLTCKSDRSAIQCDTSLPNSSRVPAPAILFCDRRHTCVRRRTAAELCRSRLGAPESCRARLDRGPRSVNRPGHPGPAAKSWVRPGPREQITWSVFVLVFGLPAYVGFRTLSPLADPAAVSELPRSGSPRPCGMRGVRNALSGSFPERNRGLRLKRWWRTHRE